MAATPHDESRKKYPAPESATTLPPDGLTGAEAARHLAADGPNLLPGAAPGSVWAIVFGMLREPMFLMLLAAGGIHLLLGDKGEALFLLGFVFVVIGITLAQERKTRRALESLRDLSALRALVIRDGREQRIAGHDLPPLQFIKAMRLNNAALLLRQGATVREAAYAVGYVSASQFSREFRRQFNTQPRVWSRAHEGETIPPPSVRITSGLMTVAP